MQIEHYAWGFLYLMQSSKKRSGHGAGFILNFLELSQMTLYVMLIIGGAPVSRKYAEDIHADAYSANAPQGVDLINGWLSAKVK